MFKLIDSTARSQYPGQLGRAVVTQVEQGNTTNPADGSNRTTYHVVYMNNGKYYEVNYP